MIKNNMETKYIRLSKVAKELNVGVSTIVEYLSEQEIIVDNNPNAKITLEQYEILKKNFKPKLDGPKILGNLDLSYDEIRELMTNFGSGKKRANENHEEGEIVRVKVNKIVDNGYYCKMHNGNDFGFLPRQNIDIVPGNELKIGEKLTLVIYKITKKGFILLSSENKYNALQDNRKKQREEWQQKQKMKSEQYRIQHQISDFVEKNKIGVECVVEVVEVKRNYVVVDCGGVKGLIRKEDTNWNEIDRLEDLLFEGEIINAVYVKHENGQLFFSLKLLNEKPYDDKFYDLSLSDLLRYAGHDSNVFIGQAKQSGNFAFIENLYSCDENQKGKLLVDPIYGYNLKAVVINQFEDKIAEGEYYKVKLSRLVDKIKRLERNQLFQFTAEIIAKVDNPYKMDVDSAFRKLTSPAGNVAIAHLLKEVVGNMLAAKDRMFFELVQNADDAASRKGVRIKVKTEGDFLVVSHNGVSFDKDDFDAIVSAANGTKKTDENKTGYKGIGFKTVFKEANRVFIKTGGYQFKFDKSDERFTDFDSFYFLVNDLKTKEQQRNFLANCMGERNKFKGVEDIPWQLEPIWVDLFPEKLGLDFTKSNVAIALEIGENKIFGNDGYCQAIEGIINNPKFMLFLRNTTRIDFNDKSVSKLIKDGEIILKNSFDESHRFERFKIHDYKVKIGVIEERSLGFRQNIIEQNNEGKIINANFVDSANQIVDNIPSKIALNEYTTISFAIPIDENGAFKQNDKKEKDISIFAFLPTLVKEFDFSVFINANFLLTPDRQHILGDNPWNYFLMEELANKLVELAANLCLKKDSKALMVLKPKYFEYQTPDVKQLAEHFNSAYKSALETEAFILNHKGGLARQDEIIIDKTGLSEIVGADLFCQLLDTEKCLPSDNIDSKILEEDVFEHIETLKFDDVIGPITNNSDFNVWFASATDEQKKELYKWIDDNDITSRNDDLRSFVANLRLFRFFDTEYSSYRSIISDKDEITPLITTPHILPIRSVLNRLDFQCSDDLFDENHPLFKYIDLPKEEDLFNSIKDCDFSDLSTDERKTLFFALADFDGVGEARLKEIALFKNLKGDPKPLGEMVVNNIEYPIWLNDYIIAKEEYTQGLDKYMISDEHIFQEIVQTHYSDLEYSSVLDLYNHFRAQWTSTFTKTLIDKYGTTDDLLTIVERTDGAKHYFIEKYGRINLDNSTTADSIEYKLIRLALSSDYDVSKLKKIIFIDNKNIADYTISPEVSITIDKEYLFPLSEILLNQSDDYATFNQVKDLLSDITGSDALFSLTRMKNSDVRSQLQLEKLSTPTQYAFYVCYNIANNYRSAIPITDEQFVKNVLDYFFDNKIDVLGRYIIYFPNQKIIGRFINSDEYTLESERLSYTIRQWADNEEKEKFLIALGAKGNLSDEIKRRKTFLNNDPISLSYSSNITNEIISFLNWCITLETPFTKDNQVKVLKEMFSRLNRKTEYDNNDYQNAKEWDNKRYIEYVQNKLSIFCIDGEMPKRGVYNNVHIFTEFVGDYVFLLPNRLYVNVKDKKMETVLFSVSDDRSLPLFTKDDWTKLFMVSIETLNEKENEIVEKDEKIKMLEEENQKLAEIIDQYRIKHGDLNSEITADSQSNSKDNTTVINDQNTTIEKTATVSGVPDAGISTRDKLYAQLEAQKRLKQELSSDWYFPDNYGEIDENKKPFYYSTIEVINKESGDSLFVVLKSYKKQDEPFRVNPEEWDYLIKKRAKLWIYTLVNGEVDIVEIPIQDLIRNQNKITISFSTANLDIEQKIDAFADSLHFFNEMHLDFDSFNVSKKAQSVKSMYIKNKRGVSYKENTLDEI